MNVVPGLSRRFSGSPAGRAGPLGAGHPGCCPSGPPVGYTESLSRSQRASEGETRLLRGLLGLAAESASEEQLVPLPPVVRLSQARGHLCARKLF